MATLLVSGLAVAACTGGDDPTDTTLVDTPDTTTALERESDGVLSIGLLYPQTGEGATTIGDGVAEAVNNTVTDINAAGGVLGSAISVLPADEVSDTAMAELLAEGVDAIVGPASSLVALEHLGEAVEAGVVVCSPAASAIALDEFPDDDFFYRTIPSDTLQMHALEQVARATGASTIAVAYLDDPYGRGLAAALEARIEAMDGLDLVGQVPFSSADQDLTEAAREIQAGADADADPDVIVVLADGNEGGRFLTALDSVVDSESLDRVYVNDAVRTASQVIGELSDGLREQIRAVAPATINLDDDDVRYDEPFAAHAADCVNLLALAATRAQTDRPRDFRDDVPIVSYGGERCNDFAECADLLAAGERIDYDGASGPVDVRTNRRIDRARFDEFGFDANGAEVDRNTLILPSIS